MNILKIQIQLINFKIKMATKELNTDSIRQGWPLLLKYDIDYFNVPRTYLVHNTGIIRSRLNEIERDKEATLDELANITRAFNKYIAKRVDEAKIELVKDTTLKVCKRCKSENNKYMRFCFECGTLL